MVVCASCRTPGAQSSETGAASGAETVTPDMIRAFFHDQSGEIVASIDVARGADARSPAYGILPDGFVFTGWDRPLRELREDTHFYPLYEDIRTRANVVFAPAVYAADGETVAVRVQLGGDVSFACMELQVSFDETVLSLESIADVDADGVCHYDEQSHTVRFAMAAARNIDAGVDLFTLHFTVHAPTQESTAIGLQVDDMAHFDDAGQLVSAPYGTVNGKVIFN